METVHFSETFVSTYKSTQCCNLEDPSALQMEALYFSDTLVSTDKSIRCYNPEDPLCPEDGDSIFIRNVGIYLQVHTVLQARRPFMP
jgi:hypothetical protein